MKPLLERSIKCFECEKTRKVTMKYEAICKNHICSFCREEHTLKCKQCNDYYKQRNYR